MNYTVKKESRNLSVLIFNEMELDLEECQLLYDDGYRPIMAYGVKDGMEVLCEKVEIGGVRGLH